MSSRFLLPAILAILSIGFAPRAVDAQGRGRPKTPHAPTTPNTQTTASTSSTPSAPVLAATTTVSFRQFGSWLDDASVSSRGEGYTSIGFGYWRMAGTSQTDVPMVSGGLGVSDRMQVSASVPFYAANYDGATTRGVDDVYIGAKYSIVDPTLTLSEIGFAVSPVLEVLSGAPSDRVHAAIPVSIELRRTPFRYYASAGYFTRGSAFSGGAVEWSSARGLVLTGSVTQAYSVKADVALDQAGVSRQRADVSASLGYPLAQRVSLSMSIGRSLTSIEQGGTSLALSGGATFRFTPR